MHSLFCALLCAIFIDEDRYALSKEQKPWLEDPNEGSQTLFKHASAKSVHLFIICTCFYPMIIFIYAVDTSPKLSDLMNEVAAKAPPSRWKAFAAQLGLNYECIRRIQNENAGNISDTFMAVFYEWSIQQTTPYTWETVISALSSDSLKELRLAKALSERFIA